MPASPLPPGFPPLPPGFYQPCLPQSPHVTLAPCAKDLASPTHSQASPRPVSPVPPLPTPPQHVHCSDVMDSSLPFPSHPSRLNTYLLSAFTLPSTPPPPSSTQPINNSPPHPQRTPRPLQNLRILQWNAGGLSPSRCAELIAFLSNNQYDLILLQETHLSATKKF